MSQVETAISQLDPKLLLKTLRAFRRGDFSARLPSDLTGIDGEIAEAFNDIADLNKGLAQELDRVAKVVGKEGRIGERGRLAAATGCWSECIDSVNSMIGDLVQPTTEVARVIGAVAKGDLSQSMQLEIEGRPLRGEFLRIGKVVNTMVGQLSSFASEVTRVAKEVGTEGKLGGQAQVKGVAGTWKDLTDNVNMMAANLTGQVRNIAEVTTAVANGNLSKKITVDVKGEMLELKNTINTMVDQLNSFASEVTRVAKEVGTEGKLGGQAQVKGVGGTWKDLTDNVNMMAANLTGQVRGIAEVVTAVAVGNLTRKLTVDAKGEIAALADTINGMIDTLATFADQVTNVAREVGIEGKLGGQALVPGAAGLWRDLTDNVNMMAANLTGQVRNIADVTTAVANGDLSKKITVDVKGEMLELKNTINTMVDQLNSFASEVTRVAREVGTEGKLGGQAQVRGVGGTWKDLTDNVNMMAANLTGQVRNIADVTTAVANGDLSKKITVDVRGELLELKNTINTMVDQLNSFASEVTRVAKEVGTEGKLGGQARVEGVGGVWKGLTDNVNMMAANLTGQVRNIADVTTAVANGDLSKKITVDVRGELLELKNTINTMVDQLNSFASEVTRVAKEVGSEGKLGGQAQVKGVGGVWKGLTDNVNLMAANLTGQVRGIAEVVTAVATGDLSKKITVVVEGEMLELKSTINTMVDQLNSFASEVTRVAREVGSEGKLGGQAQVKGVAGTWKDLTDNVNMMAANLTGQVRNIADVTTAVANGDLSKKITVDVKGEMLELKNTINTMVDQLNSFASEVTRVAREVGTEGKLGGQAQVRGVGGTWKDLTDNVNMMAANLTGQVRNIADVTTAVANGNLSKKITVDVKGEMLELKNTINTMVDQLNSFASEVTRVAKEVGTEGKLGGQARVEGVSGLWRDLTDNVNQLAANLTNQVRAIAEVATAVTRGDLTRSITAEALGELAALKDNINEMIRNLRDTTLKNAEQDWLKTNLAKFTRMLQGERDLATVSNMILSEIAPLVNAQQGVFYTVENRGDEPTLELVASYAFTERKHLGNRFRLREGLVGQVAYEKKRILLTNAPNDYIKIGSALGEAAPLNIIVLPVLFEQEVKAVIELASFNRFSETHQSFLDQLTESIGIVLNTIAANMRTEGLLKQSQLLTSELQSQQEELRNTNDRLEQQAATLRQSEELLRQQQDVLQKTNEELEDKARLLEIQKREVETKNQEVSIAKTALEEKAEQLSLTSRYKSQFLANMSHELRTPLNSLLILSKLLTENSEGNLTDKQKEFAKTIHAAGSDLLSLINDILDLSKIESGTVSLEVSNVAFKDLVENMDRTFRQVAEERKLHFQVEVDPKLPLAIRTDSKRLQQVLRNLLSNAFKFTERGGVTLQIGSAEGSPLRAGSQWIAMSVTDTGIGIPEDKQRIIFEAFQQADGTTSRKYGGTGLGLSISREIARLLGGEIVVSSTPGSGSTFTLFVPVEPPSSHGALGTTSAVRSNGDGSASYASPEDAPGAMIRQPSAAMALSASLDDRHAITVGDRIVLIIEDDAMFASVLLELAREEGFKGLIAMDGASALALAHRYKPHAITLDIGLPDMDGWALLDLLKHDPRTRHVPIHVISVDDQKKRGLKAGAFGFLEKPVDREALMGALNRTKEFIDRPVKKLLLVEDDDNQRMSLSELMKSEQVDVTAVGTAEGALEVIQVRPFDCAIVDLGLPDLPGAELIERIRKTQGGEELPIVIYTGQDLTREEERRLQSIAATIVVKGEGSSERLLNDTALFLHRAISAIPEEKHIIVEHRADGSLDGRKVLIIDDDMRNIFSLTSALEQHGISVIFAENGLEGIEKLQANPDVDVALVDIMMPEMDGYETMREIRNISRYHDLPLVAVTAKAMKGDREKCLEAGATDYVSKPVDIDQLLAVLRVQLSRSTYIPEGKTAPNGAAGVGLSS
ncbi:HAMP domain-containing protein/signal transduction histidine kinase/DNA-binding response OmpR family regulator [Microvirga lupini]|uniref:histidine kinase n=1 Tax=Microvirga lupini TaxID=420324 RepID=A0A7W4VJB1_9HYPH|nr:HAMP domain-containing protein [Microvirga lupini]MBB3018219.1 HAMP domain-containing protein/signal transduction histidine kinase/DNA-binding response OmpR family regulator [Microvirga lupini]